MLVSLNSKELITSDKGCLKSHSSSLVFENLMKVTDTIKLDPLALPGKLVRQETHPDSGDGEDDDEDRAR